jgi:hypothetical protein
MAGVTGHRRASRAALAGLVAACALAAAPAAASAATPGVVVPFVRADAATLGQIQASGARNVRVFASWNVLEPQPGQFNTTVLANFDDFINRLRAMGLGVYFVVTATPAWAGGGPANAPPPPGPYADFLRRLVAHFRGRVSGYEVWNEENWPTFWAGGAQPSAYATLLRAAYPAAKSADPAAQVGVGGLLGNDYRYLESLYGAGAGGYFDFVGVHYDNDCMRADPRTGTRDPDGRISPGSFTAYREVHQTMLDHGDNKPIWMTEVGWSVTSARCPSRPGEPAGVSLADQATFLTRAYACLAADPYVQNATWFSLSDFGSAETIANRFGLFDFSGVARPALSAFQQAGSVAPDPSCGLSVDRGGPQISVQVPWNQQNRSGDLLYRVSASDSDGLATLALLVDGRQVRVTSKGKLEGRWTGWRKFRLGPHTVTIRAKDLAQNVSTSTLTVNKVRYGDGEPIRTRISVGVYGTGGSRVAGGRLFTIPAAARPLVRGRLSVHWERQVGRRWRPFGRAAAVTLRGMVRARRHFGGGRYRAVIEFPGYKSFRPSVGRRVFTVG